jgi:tetratricopeptide (TPR) repeat protein
VLLERDIGPRHADIAPLLDDLALVSVERGDPSTASGLQRRALVLRTAALGVGHPQVALTLEHLAETKRREGRLEEALLFAHRALATYEGLYGARHPDVARVLGRIGAIHRERGDARAADLYLGRALDIVDPDGAHRLNADDGGISGSPGASLLADVFAEMGVLRGRQGRFRIARRFLARAFRLYDGASNASPRQAEILLEMARTYRLEARRRMALAHLRVGLRLADELPRIPAVKAAIHEALGDWYAQAGMIAQADRHRSSARDLLAGS